MHQPKYLLAYCSLRISITMCEAKGERFFTMFRMTNTQKSYILATCIYVGSFPQVSLCI